MSNDTRGGVSPDQQAMWDALGILGFDQDGDKDPGALIAGMGADGFRAAFLRDVTETRKDHDAAIDEVCMCPGYKACTCPSEATA